MERKLGTRALLALSASTCAILMLASAACANGNGNSKELDADLVAARQKFFGPGNVDEKGRVASDKVILSWITNASFAASIAGRVVLLDTFMTRLEVTPGRTPFVIKDLVDLEPEAIMLGHGHSDHADNAAYIAAKTGATIYASEETCAAMQADFARELADPAIQGNPDTAFPPRASLKCMNVTTAGSVPGTQVVKLNVLEPDACVIAFRHLHSVAVPVDPTWPRAPTPSLYYTPDPRDPTLFPAGTPLTPSNPPQPGQINIATGSGNGPGGPVAIFYDFVLRGGQHFTLAWNNSAGALKEGKGNGWDGTPADGQRIINVMKSLPQTDVQLGTIATANFDNNAYRDPFAYVQALNPKIFLPIHLTTGSTFRESVSVAVYSGYLDQLKRLGISSDEWPETQWLVDPADYGRPIVYDINDDAWRNKNKEPRIRQFCGGGKNGGHDDDDHH